jgi:hypothetical protein
MRHLFTTFMIASLAIMGLNPPLQAETVKANEALTVAQNWITLIVQTKGNWSGFETAEAQEIREFKRGDRVLGYFCPVKPKGFIVISRHKALAAVKAYSATCDLDPESDEGLTDVIKGGMERVLDGIEQRLGPIETLRTGDLENILEINYRSSWEHLGSNVVKFRKQLQSDAVEMDYQEGEVLISTLWHQYEPYNDQCPTPDEACSWSCGFNENAKVGCVAVCISQILRHWSWPPYGTGTHSYIWEGQTIQADFSDSYDWPNMPNRFFGCDFPQEQVDAVAELCHEAGVAKEMRYGCGSSSTGRRPFIEDVYPGYFRYSNACIITEHADYSSIEWFERLKTQFNKNRPVHYIIPGHAIAGDGWQEIGTPVIRQYHMNYGYGSSNSNTWYTLDELSGGNPETEFMFEDIVPDQALGNFLLNGTYMRNASFPYRYFDQDATGDDVTFQSGQYLQFLPNIDVTCTSTSGGSIRFYGSSSLNTRLFSRGDTSRGIRIRDGGIKLHKDGGVTLR